MDLLYDVAHNIAKIEEHAVGGATQAALRAPQGGDAGLSRRAPRHARSATARSASR